MDYAQLKQLARNRKNLATALTATYKKIGFDFQISSKAIPAYCDYTPDEDIQKLKGHFSSRLILSKTGIEVWHFNAGHGKSSYCRKFKDLKSYVIFVTDERIHGHVHNKFQDDFLIKCAEISKRSIFSIFPKINPSYSAYKKRKDKEIKKLKKLRDSYITSPEFSLLNDQMGFLEP